MDAITAYEWLQFNDKFDCIVSIAIDKIPVSVGIFISSRNVITSVNPLNHVVNNSDRVSVYSINGYYNASKAMAVQRITISDVRSQILAKMDTEVFEDISIHDIAIITVSEQIWVMPKNLSNMRPMRPDEMLDEGRKPYPIKLPNNTVYDLPLELVFAGFGYLDQEHVQNNTILEVSFTTELLADCDEWIPREWGTFICFIDTQDLYSLASGAPLFDDPDMTTVYGIGCFSLKKGKEKLLVFTDLRPYVDALYEYRDGDD